MKGDAKHGVEIFNNCVICHRIGENGIDFGPNLSEIGTKLGKDAIYEAILSPVSYTHLDVYKRQHQYRNRSTQTTEGCRPRTKSRRQGGGDESAVSYTHLEN